MHCQVNTKKDPVKNVKLLSHCVEFLLTCALLCRSSCLSDAVGRFVNKQICNQPL